VELRTDVSAEECRAVLLGLADDVENVRGYGSGGDPNQREIYARKYLAWVDHAESRQRHLWVGDGWMMHLHTLRWQTITAGNAAPNLVNGEIDYQAQRLRTLAAQVGCPPKGANVESEGAHPSLSLRDFHPMVVAACSTLFDTGHYSQAIFEAFKSVEMAVRDASGLDLSGVALMNRAMGDAALLRMSRLAGMPGRDEQSGMRSLFVGAMQGIRNPKAHGSFSLKDRQRALEYLAFASLLLRRLDDATYVGEGETG